MAYATITDLTRFGLPSTALTGVSSTTQEEAISAASSLADSYLRSRYDLPLTAYGDDLAGWLEYGASPRATIGLDRCARAHAWLAGRDFVAPEDIQAVAYDVLRHRVILHFEAEAEGVTPDQVVGELIARIAVP